MPASHRISVARAHAQTLRRTMSSLDPVRCATILEMIADLDVAYGEARESERSLDIIEQHFRVLADVSAHPELSRMGHVHRAPLTCA